MEPANMSSTGNMTLRARSSDYSSGSKRRLSVVHARPPITRGTTTDRIDMQRMGKHQELQRHFRELSSVSFTSCVMGMWEILLTACGPVLRNGGLPGLFWSLVWTLIGQCFVVLSLAEMSSMAPTSTGQPHWVSEFGPRGCQRLLSFCTGWLATIAWQSVIAADCSIIANMIQAVIHINNPLFAPTQWQGALLTIATVFVLALFNIYAAGHLSFLEGLFAICHVYLLVPVIVILWVLAPKSSHQDVFVNFTNGGAWPVTGLAVLVGQVSNIFVCLGSDAVAHLAEEVEDAALIVPQSMVWSYFINAPLTLILAITLCYNTGSVEAALESMHPLVWIFHNTLQSIPATTAFTSLMLILMAMITVSNLATTSRQMFAFARDNGLPYSKYLKRISAKHRVPVNAILVTAGFTAALSVVNIGSSAAFNTMLSLSTSGLMASYMLSIGCILRKRLRNESLPHARWSLGKAGLAVNSLALFYASWSFFWSFWPSQYNVTAANFNWALVILACLMGLACTSFGLGFLGIVYEGPVVRVQTWLNV